MKKRILGVLACALFLATFFVSFPVFAEESVDIEIIEVVDDGSGDYQPWEDITDAMPGETYSLIPRVINYGEDDTYVFVCITESGQNAEGNSITIPKDTFLINFESGWTKQADGNCYYYDTILTAGAITTSLFNQVTINGEVGNEYQNSTFNLTLTAVSTNEEPNNPDEPVVTTEQEKPNTGFYTSISSAMPVPMTRP